MALYFEIFFILLIVSLQLFLFGRNYSSISQSKTSIPEGAKFWIKHVNINKAAVLENTIQDVVKICSELPDMRSEKRSHGEIRLQLIFCNASNSIIAQILYAINTYLIKNKGAATDFNLIKDIVERHTDAQDRDISIALPLPLYLGLMGTMTGIIIGLFGMGNISDIGTDLSGIDNLLGGVKIAMIASAMGLLLTTVNSGIFYKGSKALIESRKNTFYTFIQVELLPVLSQNINKGIIDLNKSFENFTHSFHNQLDTLGGIVANNHNTLVSQQNVLESLENIDLSVIAKYNVSVAKELSKHIQSISSLTGESEKLVKWLNQLDSFISSTTTLNNTVSAAIQKGDKIGELTDGVSTLITNAGEQQEFLRSHFSALEDRKDLIQRSVANVDNTLDKSLSDLSEFTRKKIEEFQQHTIKWDVQMEDSFQANTGALSKLGRLDDLKQSFDKMLINQEALLKGIENMDTHFRESNQALLTALTKKNSSIWASLGRVWSRLISELTRPFKSNKK